MTEYCPVCGKELVATPALVHSCETCWLTFTDKHLATAKAVREAAVAEKDAELAQLRGWLNNAITEVCDFPWKPCSECEWFNDCQVQEPRQALDAARAKGGE